jgi:hypothetical protein
VTTGISDPDGGSAAISIEDNHATLQESITDANSSIITGVSYILRTFIGRDAITSRFPEVILVAGASSANVQVGTESGAVDVRASSGFTNVSARARWTDDVDWMEFEISFTSDVTDTLTVDYAPAASATLGGALDGTLTGTITVHNPVLYEEVNMPTPNVTAADIYYARFVTQPVMDQAEIVNQGLAALLTYQRVLDGTDTWCYYSKLVIDPTPAITDTVPNHNGSITHHQVLGTE